MDEEGAFPTGMVVVIIISLLLGGFGAYFAKKFIETYSTMLLGAFGLGMVIFFVIDKIDV